MQKLSKKIISTVLAVTLVGTHFIPVMSFAANEVNENQEELQSITFDANFKNEHTYVASLDEELSLDISLGVSNNGYIQNGTIIFENNNYKLGNIEDENIDNVKENEIELKTINKGKQLNLSIPIEFERKDQIDSSYFKKDSKVTLNATYINDAGESETIIKSIENHLEWDLNTPATVKQELKRYLKYEDKTLVSFLVSSGVKENKFPLLEKKIQISVPKIADKEPSKIILPEQEYTYQDNILEINKKYTNEEDNTITWNSNDEFLVTYVYDAQMEETILEAAATMTAKTASEKDIEVSTEENTYNVSEQVGSLLETKVSGDTEVNKGYLYTNLNRQDNKIETPFNTHYQINIGIVDLIDEIQLRETNNNGQSLVRKISVNKDELVNALGEDGLIRVLDINNQELGILNKDILELNLNNYGLTFITSKPVKEGNINLSLEKVINPELKYTKQALISMNDIENSIDVFGVFQGNQISNNHIESKISLVEPTSNATLEVSKTNLSTVVKNENVVITATLERNDIADALYTNPELLITLPSQISQIELKDARLIYEDELVPVNFRAEGNIIYLQLEGTQTEYTSLPNVNGTVVKIVADLSLDNLAVNSDTNIIMQYTNRSINDEIKSIDVPVKIVAPTGFVTANSATLSQTVTGISDNQIIPIKANDIEKQINLSGIVVSNLSESATGFMILGRIPSQGTVSVDGNNIDLGSTYATTLATAMVVEGLDCDIYYSDNGAASYDLQDGNNGWSLEARDSSKSYLIVAKGEVNPGQRINFNYNTNIPRNLDYENRALSVFGVYYDNKSEEGTTKNVISSKTISIETENIPIIKTEITAVDYNTGETIENGSEVNLGKFIKYTIHVTNTGRKAAEGVNIKAFKPENGSFYIVNYLEEGNAYDNYYDYSDELTQLVGTIEPGETKIAEFIVDTSLEIQDSVTTLRAQVTADNMEEDSTASFENKIIEGTLELKISSMMLDEEVKIGQELTYYVTAENYGKTIKDITLNIEIPKNIKLEEYEDGRYDEKTRILSYDIKSLNNEKFYVIRLKVESSEEPNQEIALIAKAQVGEKEIKSNRYVKTVKDSKGITGKLSSNIVGRMLDTDTVEYYINVKNESKKAIEISIMDYLPEELAIESYIVRNGNKGYTKENVGILGTIIEEVQAGETLKVTIIAKPYILDSIGQVKEIENKAEIIVNGEKIELNTIKQEIEGTSNFNTVSNTEKEEKEENIYSISGKVWYDENGNSKQDENEIGMLAVPLRLYDVNAKDYIKDEEGNALEIYTNDNGEYKFENLSNGEYMVSASYDSEAYIVANYQEGELSQNENNDFIESKIEDATSNIIKINGENVYNTDLGLIDIDNFNITVNNNISKISVIDEKETKTFEVNANTANLKVPNKANSMLVVEYNIDVVNEGNIDGYVTKVINTIPTGMRFISELNNDWYIDENGNAVNTSIANTKIKSGEKVTLKIVLVQELNEENKELLGNAAEIGETYNQYGVEEIKKDELTNTKARTAQIIVVRSTDNETMQVVEISLSIIVGLVLVGAVAYKLMNRETIHM